MTPMWKPAVLAVVLVVTAATARAQISTSATPIYHGELDILPAVGTIDGNTGIGTLRVRGWRLVLADTSNGIFPDREPVVVALGEESSCSPRDRSRARVTARCFATTPPPVPDRAASTPSASRGAPTGATWSASR